MRNWILVIVAVALGTVVAIRESIWSSQIKSFQQAREEDVAQQREIISRLDRLEGQWNSQRDIGLPTAGVGENSTRAVSDTSDIRRRVGGLEKEVARINAKINPEYDPTSPSVEPEPEPQSQIEPKRSWGPEQITGPPDVDHEGDSPLAWAALQADGGPEWLSAGFPKSVEVAQVRIRESYNAGGIIKVSAMANGLEMPLWEGDSARGKAPRDFVVSAPPGIVANSVFVHLDTRRVTGWEEIDAIELLGRDGSRQWASSANASSSYADRTVASQSFDSGAVQSRLAQ